MSSKNSGGLGLRSARNMNMAIMMKAGWNLCHRSNDMWVRTIKLNIGAAMTLCLESIARELDPTFGKESARDGRMPMQISFGECGVELE